MTAFATVDDLALLTGRTFTAAQEEQVEALLEAASAYLRGVIGQDVFPATTSTYEAYPLGGREDLPQWPVVSVDAVERDGEEIDYTYRPGYIKVSGDDPVDITFTWGYESAPPNLTRVSCVLVSDQLTAIELGLGLSKGGLSSLALDDFKAAFADNDGAIGELTPHAEASVRQQFGRGSSDLMETV